MLVNANTVIEIPADLTGLAVHLFSPQDTVHKWILIQWLWPLPKLLISDPTPFPILGNMGLIKVLPSVLDKEIKDTW